MATYTVTNKYLIDNFAVLQLLTPSEIAVGSSITVAGVDATFNGTYTVRALPQYLFIGIDTEGDLLYDYQVPIAEFVAERVDEPVAVVGQITTGTQAEEILQQGKVEVVMIGRAELRDPMWPLRVASELGVEVDYWPKQYSRGKF